MGKPRVMQGVAALATRGALWALLVLACPFPGRAVAEPGETWLLVDTDSLTLSVMRGEAVLHTFDNIAIGSNGATRHKRAGDEKTPLGEFRITAIRGDSRFHRFLAIDYPTLEDARRGLGDGRISQAQYDKVRRAREAGGVPPQDTPLGGHLGIHGIGAGDPAIHDAFNWTNGCIALTDEQVEALLQWARVGTRVSVRQPPPPRDHAN